MGVGERDLELVERRDRARRQPVATDLVATVRALLDHDDAGAGPRRPDRHGGTRRSATDDRDVESFTHPTPIQPESELSCSAMR